MADSNQKEMLRTAGEMPGSMHDGSKRRGDELVKEEAPPANLVINYLPEFDLHRLETMQIAYQGSKVLAFYAGRPWETEHVGELIPASGQYVVPKVAAKPKPKMRAMVFHEDVVTGEDVSEGEAFDEFLMWNRIEDGDYQMNIPSNEVAFPKHEVQQVHVPSHVRDFKEWKSILIEMPAYKSSHMSFADMYTQSFRDRSAENYCRYLMGRFSKDIPMGKPWQPKTQGPDLTAFLMATNWVAKIDSCRVSGSSGYGSQRKFKGLVP